MTAFEESIRRLLRDGIDVQMERCSTPSKKPKRNYIRIGKENKDEIRC